MSPPDVELYKNYIQRGFFGGARGVEKVWGRNVTSSFTGYHYIRTSKSGIENDFHIFFRDSSYFPPVSFPFSSYSIIPLIFSNI